MGVPHMAQRALTEYFISKGYVSSTYTSRSLSIKKIKEILLMIDEGIAEEFSSKKLLVEHLPDICAKLDVAILTKKPRPEWTGPITEKQNKKPKTKAELEKLKKERKKLREKAREDILTKTQYEVMLSKAKDNPQWVWLSGKDFLNSYEWKHLRFVKLSTSNRKCECCNRGAKQGVTLNVDHIKPRKLYPELALDLDNLQILCGECNAGKSNFSIADFRK